jgi:AhpD family alkylhydroperoxidase
MRLSVLDHGQRRRAKLFLAMTSVSSRGDGPDIVKLLLYRPGFLSRALLDLTVGAMRGPSYWTAAEREYIGMSTARLHECPYCIDTHTELVRIADGHGEIDPDDPASVRPQLRAVSEFLDAISRAPYHADAGPDADLPESAVLEALRVNLVWNIINRLANAFGFTLRGNHLHSGTRALNRFGYRMPGFLLADGETAGHGHGDDDAGDDDHAVAGLRHSVLAGPGVTDPALRTAAATGGTLDEPWQSYAAAVRDASYTITDDDIGRLTAAGYTEDQIFEVTVAAAVGAALRSYDAGLQAIGRTGTS